LSNEFRIAVMPGDGIGDEIMAPCLELVERVRGAAVVLGAALDPFAAWLAVRGMKTLAVRMERACTNALTLARYLEEHPQVQKVHYPGLPSHPGHRLAGRLFGGQYGAMLAFELKGGEPAAAALVRGLRLVRLVPSLGDVATAISHPAKTSHRGLTPQEREAAGIGPELIRVSVGIEAIDDLLEDMERALTAPD
ncbi:MAG TPA: hypothetical protein DCM14_01800, partial [Clostridiales bacterium UBA8153]|nr:hypothetical protein [Clostridiales bacterium UBA8153]